MNNILTGKQGMQTAVMDWAEEMRARGWWVDVNTRVNCEYVDVVCGHGTGAREVEASGGDMVTALIELMKAWEAIYGEAAIIANRRANLEAAADEIGCTYGVLVTKGISEANSDEGNRELFEIWACNEKGKANERLQQAEKIEETVRRMYGGGNE